MAFVALGVLRRDISIPLRMPRLLWGGLLDVEVENKGCFLSACYSNRCFALFKPKVCVRRGGNGSSPCILWSGSAYSVMCASSYPDSSRGRGCMRKEASTKFLPPGLRYFLFFFKLPKVERQLNCKIVTLGKPFTSLYMYNKI